MNNKYASTSFYKKMAGSVSLLYSDLKTLNPEIARNRMKADISLVRENLLFAAENHRNFILRIPVIRGVNDSPAEQNALTEFCQKLKNVSYNKSLRVELLRQHHLGEPKYEASGKKYLLHQTPAAECADVENLAEKLRTEGIQTVVFL